MHIFIPEILFLAMFLPLIIMGTYCDFLTSILSGQYYAINPRLSSIESAGALNYDEFSVQLLNANVFPAYP